MSEPVRRALGIAAARTAVRRPGGAGAVKVAGRRIVLKWGTALENEPALHRPPGAVIATDDLPLDHGCYSIRRVRSDS
jgi:hypothetical protein